jgi:hypothetical protein
MDVSTGEAFDPKLPASRANLHPKLLCRFPPSLLYPRGFPIRWHCRALDEGREGLVLSYVSASVGGVMQHIGTDKRIGIISATIGRNLNDPRWQNTAETRNGLPG